MHAILADYIATKTAAAAARKAANAAIAMEGTHTLPEYCDKDAIAKAFVQLAKANKRAKAIVDGIDGAQVFAQAEARRAEKRAAKMKAERDALDAAIDARLDEIMADDTRRAMLIMEAQAAAEAAAAAAAAAEAEAEAEAAAAPKAVVVA